MSLQLAEQVAIVTGAGRGTGAAIAQVLAQAGARVAVNDINPDRAERVAATIRAAGGQAVGIQADVANKYQCVHLVETTRAEWGALHILVNNAAVSPRGTIFKMDEWDWQRCLDVNLKGIFFMSQLCGRVLGGIVGKRDDSDEAQGGVIVNITMAIAPVTPPATSAAFIASKAAVLAFTRTCAAEFSPHHIRVNAVSPGTAEPAPAEVVANSVLYLCSAAGAHLTGVEIPAGSQGHSHTERNPI